MFDPFYLVFGFLFVALAVIVYRDAKATEREQQRKDFTWRPGGNRPHGERRF